MKKALAWILAAAMTTALLAGCGQGGTPASGSAPAPASGSASGSTAAGERTLTVTMSSGDFGAGLITQALETVAENNNITLEFEVVPDDQMITVTNTKLSTGNAGDVIVHNLGLTDISAKDLAPLEGEWVDKITSTTYPTRD